MNARPIPIVTRSRMSERCLVCGGRLGILPVLSLMSVDLALLRFSDPDVECALNDHLITEVAPCGFDPVDGAHTPPPSHGRMLSAGQADQDVIGGFDVALQ